VKDCQNSHERPVLASGGPGNCASERQLMIARIQAYKTSNERARGIAKGEVSRSDMADMLGG
jgi:hypothetical protein